MPTFRVVWEYAENNGSGFNEVFYIDAADPGAALLLNKTIKANRLAMLHPLNTLLRLRSSQVDQLRITATAPVNQSGTYPGIFGPLPVGAAAVLQLGSAAGGSRKLWLRGLPDQYYNRSAVSGKDVVIPAFQTALDAYFLSLANQGYGLRKLAPQAPGPLQNRRILAADGTAKNGTSVLTLDQAPGYAIPSRVVIGRASKKDLPGLNGHYTVLNVVGAQVTIPYQTPDAQLITSTSAVIRQEQYGATHVFSAGLCDFDHFGTRTSRNPLSRSRGARRAARLRLSL